MAHAVKNDCSLFLEEVWESTRKFGNIKNFYAPKISFSKFITCMIEEGKFEMASEAIKNWYEAYKEENVFTILFSYRCEELLIDLIETASLYSYKIDFSPAEFEMVVKSCYFLLKVILAKPMYKSFLNSESIQKDLVDALRKGQTVLPAIECYNAIEEHLLVITHIEKAGKVLLDFLKNPKKFTFCRYPILLCVLVAEFMTKLKQRFPVYESFFDMIYNGFVKAGYLFVTKIKDPSVLEYHLNRRDIKNRTCLQILSQNRIYRILHASNIGSIIGRYWGGETIQHGLGEISSFTYLTRYNLFDEMSKFEDISGKYTQGKHFFFNYYSYRDVVSIRYYIKEVYNLILVILYQALIYLAVIQQNLETTLNSKFFALSRLTYFGSIALFLNKINSWIFFGNVNRWYIEIDSLIGEVTFIVAIIFHVANFKEWFLPLETQTKERELTNAILLSLQISYLWWKVIDSLKSTKVYGGFLRTVFIVVKRLFLIVMFLYCFVLMCTGIFNLVFQQYNQFNSYFNTFFFLAQAALQQYNLDSDWTTFLNITVCLFIGICTLILLNLIIAYATKIYDEVDDNIEPEHRGNLIKIYEYLNWDENFGIFKFLHSPFNIIQMPFSILVLFAEDKKYWTDRFTKFCYLVTITFFYFVAFLVLNILKMVYAYLHILIIQPIRFGGAVKKLAIWIPFGPVYLSYYFIIDMFKFWYYSFRKQEKPNQDKGNATEKIMEFRKLFSNLITDISENVDTEKRIKKFSIIELVSQWLLNMSSKVSTIVLQDENNRMHKRSLIIKKYGTNSLVGLKSNEISRNSHAQIFKNMKSKISIFEHFTSILYFLTKFADKEGFIDKDLAKNIFPKRNYYDDEYFEFLYYFDYRYFKTLITKFTKGTGEVRREMNKLRGVLIDITKVREKFNKLKEVLINIPKHNLKTLNNGISTINGIFAILENNLLDAESKEFFKKIMLTTSNQNHKGNNTSTYQKQNQNNKIMNKLQEMKEEDVKYK